MKPPQELLTHALADLADHGHQPPCTGDLRWISDDRDDRAEAVAGCIGCPVITECRDAADDRAERWHVWGGTDRSPASKRKST